MRDTLMYVKKLEAVGIPRNQAEAQVQIMTEVVDMEFATKHDLKDAVVELRTEIKDVRSEMIVMEHRLVNKMGQMMVAGTGLTVTIIGLMIKFL